MKPGHREDIRLFQRHDHLVRQGEARDSLFLIEEGWACQYCLLPDGHRQITSLFLPGDYCEPHWLLSGRADMPIIALTAARAQVLPISTLHAQREDGVMKVFAAILNCDRRQSAWLVNLGRKSAIERVCDLLKELYDRLQAQGRVMANRCTVPLTQQDIADIVGLTPVHVNRVLATLRSHGLAEFSGKTLHLPRPEAVVPSPPLLMGKVA